MCLEAKKIYISQEGKGERRKKKFNKKKNYIFHRTIHCAIRGKRRKEKGEKKNLHQPGIEPGSVPWQGTILPLDHWCCEC